MKSLAVSIAALALLAGCSTSTQATHPTSAHAITAPAKRTVAQRRAKKVVHPQMARLQRDPYAAPGQMDVSWTPKLRQPMVHPKPKSKAKPYFTSNKNTRGRLFVVPTKREQ